MTGKQKAQALVDGGLADDLSDAVSQLLDMGEISWDAADRILAQALRQEARDYAVKFGETYGTEIK